MYVCMCICKIADINKNGNLDFVSVPVVTPSNPRWLGAELGTYKSTPTRRQSVSSRRCHEAPAVQLWVTDSVQE